MLTYNIRRRAILNLYKFGLSLLSILTIIWIFCISFDIADNKDLMPLLNKTYNHCKITYIIEAPHLKGVTCERFGVLYIIAINSHKTSTFTDLKGKVIIKIESIK